MNTHKVFAYLLSSKKALWILALLLLVTGGCMSVWMHIDRIKTDDFESIHSAISPDIPELFDQARQKFASGGYWYEMNSNLSRERYGVEGLDIIQFEEENGTVYEVLFAFTEVVRGFGGGYYYTPSGKLPPWAPTFGVVCSKRMDDFWYAFRTVDSEIPPSSRNCPEDIQYRQ